jgi:dUTP pyrophosphatase
LELKKGIVQKTMPFPFSQSHMTAVHFEALYDDVVLPIRATEGSAGYDIEAYLTGREITWYDAQNEKHTEHVDGNCILLMPFDRAMIPTGFKTRFEKGMEAQIRSRSGLSLKQGLAPINTPGTVDADFPGEWFILLCNHSGEAVRVAHGDRIAQVVFNRFEEVIFVPDVVSQSTSRVGGFGSTGL